MIPKGTDQRLPPESSIDLLIARGRHVKKKTFPLITQNAFDVLATVCYFVASYCMRSNPEKSRQIPFKKIVIYTFELFYTSNVNQITNFSF